jgi:hypothetical protein
MCQWRLSFEDGLIGPRERSAACEAADGVGRTAMSAQRLRQGGSRPRRQDLPGLRAGPSSFWLCTFRAHAPHQSAVARRHATTIHALEITIAKHQVLTSTNACNSRRGSAARLVALGIVPSRSAIMMPMGSTTVIPAGSTTVIPTRPTAMPTLPATVIPARPAAINVYDPGFWPGFDVIRRLAPVVSSLVLHLKVTLRFQTTFPDRINNSINLFIDGVEARLNGVMN